MNLLAVVVAALSSFLVGGLWYSPALFGADGIANPGAIPRVKPAAILHGYSA